MLVIKYLLALISLVAAAPAPQSPNPVKIKDVKPNGSGCPKDSVVYEISGDGTLMTVTYSAFEANIGPNNRFNFRKNCHLIMNLEYPRGYQVALVEVITRSYLRLDQDVTARESVVSYFSGSSKEVTSDAGPFIGPSEIPEFQTKSKFAELLYSDCVLKPALNIKTVVSLNNDRNRKGEGTIGVESTDANIKSRSFTQVFKLDYKKCP